MGVVSRIPVLEGLTPFVFLDIQITHPKAVADAPVVPLALHVAVDVVTLVAVAAAAAAGAAVDAAVVTRAFRNCEDVAA